MSDYDFVKELKAMVNKKKILSVTIKMGVCFYKERVFEVEVDEDVDPKMIKNDKELLSRLWDAEDHSAVDGNERTGVLQVGNIKYLSPCEYINEIVSVETEL